MQLPSVPLASESNLAALLLGGLSPTPGPLAEGASASGAIAPLSSETGAFAELLDDANQPACAMAPAGGALFSAPSIQAPGETDQASSTPVLSWPFSGGGVVMAAPVTVATNLVQLGEESGCGAEALAADTEAISEPEPKVSAGNVAVPPSPKKLRLSTSAKPDAGDKAEGCNRQAPADERAVRGATAEIDSLALAMQLPPPTQVDDMPTTSALNIDLEDEQNGEKTEPEDRMAEFVAAPIGTRQEEAAPLARNSASRFLSSNNEGSFVTKQRSDTDDALTTRFPINEAASRAYSRADFTTTRPEATANFEMAEIPSSEASPGFSSNFALLSDRPQVVVQPALLTEAVNEPLKATAPVVVAPPMEVKSAPTAASAPAAATVSAFELQASTNEVANFAAGESRSSAALSASNRRDSKSFLKTDSKGFVNQSNSFGTDVANSFANMPASPNHVHAAHSALEGAVAVSSVVERQAQDFSTLAAAAPAPETAVGAQRAVEAVLKAVEHSQHAERPAVNLQFSVGGAELDVRVEMRAEEIRAIFRTDSSELRAALSQEWQHATSSPSDRSPRAVTPVFADASGFTAFSGDSSSRQRGSRTREAENAFSLSAARGRSRAESGDPVGNSAATMPRILSRTTSRHLSTLA